MNTKLFAWAYVPTAISARPVENCNGSDNKKKKKTFLMRKLAAVRVPIPAKRKGKNVRRSIYNIMDNGLTSV